MNIPKTWSGPQIAAAAAAAALLLTAACASDTKPPTDEFCGVPTLAEDFVLPAMQVEEVYDIRLRDGATDDRYRSGVHFLFADSEGISAFTTTSFVRTNLEGEVLSTVSFEGANLEQVREIEGGYAANFLRSDNTLALCMFGPEGPADINDCEYSFGETFAWLPPHLYFLRAQYMVTPEQPDGFFSVSVVDTNGKLVEEKRILPGTSADNPYSIFIESIGDELVITALRQDENYCSTPMVSALSPIGAEESLVASPFVRALPEGYEMAGFFNQTGGAGGAAMSYHAEPCERAKDICAPSQEFGIVNVFDGETIKTSESKGVGEIQALGSQFARLFLNEGYNGDGGWAGEYTLTFVGPDGRPRGSAKWPMELSVDPVGSGGALAEIAPGDYVFAFSEVVRGQDRLVRVRVTPTP